MGKHVNTNERRTGYRSPPHTGSCFIYFVSDEFDLLYKKSQEPNRRKKIQFEKNSRPLRLSLPFTEKIDGWTDRPIDQCTDRDCRSGGLYL